MFLEFSLLELYLIKVLNITSNYWTLLVANKKTFSLFKVRPNFFARIQTFVIIQITLKSEEPVPGPKKIPHHAVKLEAGGKNRVVYESLFCESSPKISWLIFRRLKQSQKIIQNVFIYSQQVVKFLHWRELQFGRSFIQTCVHELIAFSASETRVYGCPPETRGRYVTFVLMKAKVNIYSCVRFKCKENVS